VENPLYSLYPPSFPRSRRKDEQRARFVKGWVLAMLAVLAPPSLHTAARGSVPAPRP